jgi:polysaccharide deacetylase family sporulation protein PdaB
MLMKVFQRIVLGSCVSLLLSVTLYVPAEAKKNRYYFEERGEVVWEVRTTEKVIALTFDDGPNPTFTPQILDVLKENQAKATFFVIGARAQKYPKVVQREAREGHEVANHTNTHPLKQLSRKDLQREVMDAQHSIFAATGIQPQVFRPPGGIYNETVVDVAKEAGCQVVIWSWNQDTKDWSRPGASRIAERVLKNVRNGDIVLLHDHGEDRSQTIEALKTILPELKKMGYRFVTVSELLQMSPRTKRAAQSVK